MYWMKAAALAIAIGLVAVGVNGCGGPAPEGQAWRVLGEDEMHGPMNKAKEEALAAKDQLIQTLKGRLKEVIQNEGAVAAIAVCSEEAMALTKQASAEQGAVAMLGRTSFKLRNPENTAPDWAAPFVEKRAKEPVFLHHAQDKRLAALLPIRLAPECLMCHGPGDAMPADVRAKIEALYPEDEAIGFQVGDLRGWVVVEVKTPEADEASTT